MRTLLLLIFLFSCSSTPRYMKLGYDYGSVSLHRFSPYDCTEIKDEKHPRLALMKTSPFIKRAPETPILEGLIFTTGSEYIQHTEAEWLVKPEKQEIFLLEGPSCHFLMKKPGQTNFSLYQVKSPDKFEFIRQTPHTKIWANYNRDYSTNFVNGGVTEHPFFGFLVAGHQSKTGKGWDVEVLNIDGSALLSIEDILENPDKSSFNIFTKKSDGMLIASHSTGGESAITNNFIISRIPQQFDSGLSVVGSYPLSFLIFADLKKIGVKVTESGEGREFKMFSINDYVNNDQIPPVTSIVPPHNARIVDLRLLQQGQESPEGVLNFENDPWTLLKFETVSGLPDPKFAVKLRYPDGKLRWHVFWGMRHGHQPIDPEGFVDIRRLNAPFPPNTLVALNDQDQWQVTGFANEPAFAMMINEMRALRESTLLGLAEKYIPLAEARSTAFKQYQERETRQRAAEYESYMNSLPVQCRKLINQPALFRGCLVGHEQTMKAGAASAARIAEQEEKIREGKRPINWRKGAMSGDNYYHLDQKKMIREIDNKLACELGRGLCIR